MPFEQFASHPGGLNFTHKDNEVSHEDSECFDPYAFKSLGLFFFFPVLVLAGLAHSLHWTESCNSWIRRMLLTFMQQSMI